MEELFVIGDIHGHYERLETLLSLWRPHTQQLVFLGDYIDRGDESLAVVKKVKSLTEEGAIALTGNHEQLFLRWLHDPNWAHYVGPNIGGMSTIASFLPNSEIALTEEQMAQVIKEEHPHIIEWLKNLPLYFKWQQFFFVHGGIDPTKEVAEETAKRDLIWIRDEFHHTEHAANEIVVFGHTPTNYLHDKMCFDIWQSPCRKKIGIDGAVFLQEGQLNALVLTKGSATAITHAVTATGVKTSTIELA